MTKRAIKHPHQIPYGNWLSPISSDLIVKDSIQLDEIRLHEGAAYWLEKRPQEKGRCVIVRHRSGKSADLLPKAYSARSKVHEYGGASYCITAAGLYFINDSDQQIYHLSDDSEVTQITTFDHHRFVDMAYDNVNQRILCVCEDHTFAPSEPVNTLVSINPANGDKTMLCDAYSFYSNPVISEDNNQLAWLCWNQPNMPWDGTQLWIASLSTDRLDDAQQIAGADNISICQPQWSPDNQLTFISDESGWWNLYKNIHQQNICLFSKQAEFGLPQWVFGQSTYHYVDTHTIHCLFKQNATDYLAELNLTDKSLNLIDSGLTSLASLQSCQASTWFIGASATSPPQITRRNNINGDIETIKTSYDLNVESKYLSTGENISFTTRHDDLAHAIYYPPYNEDYSSSGKPPLIVLCHGGPTTCSDNAFDIRKQFWTSRGFALLDVNYSGSTGFGRDYRERLNQQWGIRDVEDCCDAALFAVESDLADPDKLIIKGGSAGGYTVLSALTFHDVFSVGASYYGIGDLESLATDTHKFESRYLDQLIGQYPELKQRYIDRSPIHHVDQLNCPVIFFQGAEDYVVPKDQAEKMVSAIRSKNLAVAYMLFEDEGHGFRQAQTIEDTLNTEYYFYSRIFGFDIDENNKPVNIYNLE